MDQSAINKNMDTKVEEVQVKPEKKPDEQSGILIQGLIKIYDPETQEVFVNGRA